MRNHLLGATMALAMPAAVWSLASLPAAGQTPLAQPTSFGGCPAETMAFHACALEKAKTFNPPRTPDGQVDLQGYWRGRLTMDRSVEGVDENEPMTRSPLSTWPVAPSLIVDPPDRKIPYQPWAAEVGRKGQNFQKYIDPRTVCAGGSLSRSFSDLVQILQPADEPYVLWLFEDLRIQRVIATDGRPHIGDNIKLQTGDSVGRWEGNTLVVDTTNLNGKIRISMKGDFVTDQVHLRERFTVVDADTIIYEVTIDDPKVYTRPWTMRVVQKRGVVARQADGENPEELWEDTCHEGQYSRPSLVPGYSPSATKPTP